MKIFFSKDISGRLIKKILQISSHICPNQLFVCVFSRLHDKNPFCMRWLCKFCTYFTLNRKRIIEHYRAVHGHYGRNCALPCIYSDCPLVFRSQELLNKHLKEHRLLRDRPIGGVNLKMNCQERKKKIHLLIVKIFVFLWLYILMILKSVTLLAPQEKKHKLCAIYWVIADFPLRDRSSLSTIFLAALCKTQDVKTFGYDQIVKPLLKDLQLLENQGIYINRLGTSVRGTVIYVSSDNLDFNVEHFCRFCVASKKDIQTCSVRCGSFVLRTKESHNLDISKLNENPKLKSVNGVKSVCVLNELQYFHCITDFLHDLLEGIVPFELCLCLKKLIDRTYFTLDHLNTALQYF